MRKGNWIQTFMGIKFYPLDPHPEEILIQDIAHALSLSCRFSGHTREFYSVAQHSILAAIYMPKGKELWGLLHDASEAYLHDIPTPLKRLDQFRFYRELEDNLQKMIFKKYGLFGNPPAELKGVDVSLLLTEAECLIPPVEPWGIEGNSYSIDIQTINPTIIEKEFLSYFKLYMEEANLHIFGGNP